MKTESKINTRQLIKWLAAALAVVLALSLITGVVLMFFYS